MGTRGESPFLLFSPQEYENNFLELPATLLDYRFQRVVMKQVTVAILLTTLPVLANSQVIDRVYNRDTLANFKIKKVETNSIIKGPMVKQENDFTFDNPSKALTEASFWFCLPAPGGLSGFAYW